MSRIMGVSPILVTLSFLIALTCLAGARAPQENSGQKMFAQLAASLPKPSNSNSSMSTRSSKAAEGDSCFTNLACQTDFMECVDRRCKCMSMSHAAVVRLLDVDMNGD